MNETMTGNPTNAPAVGVSPRRKGKAESQDDLARDSLWNHPPWSWLVSIRVGIVLLAIVTVASIIGTLIAPLERAQALVFYTWWYKFLLLALSVNMMCATARTIARKHLPPLSTRIRRNPQYFETATPSASLTYSGGADGVASFLKRRGFAATVEGDCGYAIKGRFSRWGAPLSHVGLVLVLLSGFAASWIASEGYIQVLEGQTTETMVLRGKQNKEIPLGFTVRIDDFETGFFPRTRIPSKYVSTITATKGERTLYHGKVEVNQSPVIGGWTFHQTSYQEFPKGTRYRLRVQSPSMQARAELDLSPGQARAIPGMKGVEVALKSGTPLRWEVRQGDQTVARGRIGGGGGGATAGLILRADRFEPDFVIGPGRTISSRTDRMNNPALHIELLEDGEVLTSQWLFGRDDMKGMMHAGEGPYKLELTRVLGAAGNYRFQVAVEEAYSGAPVGQFDFGLNEEVKLGKEKAGAESSGNGEKVATETESAWTVALVDKVPLYATVLTLSRNPLIPVIYGACGLMMAGLFVGFFVTRKEVWFRVNQKKRLLQVAASYRYPRQELDPGLRRLLGELSGAAPSPCAAAESAPGGNGNSQ